MVPEWSTMNDKAKSPAQILIVESDINLRRGMVRGLSGPDRSVSDTANPIEAVEWLKRSHFDIVITAADFTIMDGKEALRRMREASPGTPVLILTNEVSSRKASPDLHRIEKPVSLSDLIAKIEIILKNSDQSSVISHQ